MTPGTICRWCEKFAIIFFVIFWEELTVFAFARGISKTTWRTTGLEYTANFYKQLRAACYATVEDLQLRAAR